MVPTSTNLDHTLLAFRKYIVLSYHSYVSWNSLQFVFSDKLSNKVKEFFYNPQKHVVSDLFDHEVHLFMHCHIKAYDRTGEGISMDHDFLDKFGVPNKLEHFWMEGYHSMDRRLARHMFSVGHQQIPFPPVAGYAG